MKINFSQEIKDIDGLPVHAWITDADGTAPIRDFEGSKWVRIVDKPLTVGTEAAKALFSFDTREKEKMLQCGLLAQKIYSGGEIEIDVTQAGLIQEAAQKFCKILTFVQIYQLIEAGTVADKASDKTKKEAKK